MADAFAGSAPEGVFVFQKVQVDEYFGGRRLTSQDRLGSVGQYYPYGEAKSGTVSNADSFATYYRDSTGLDYAQQRSYSAPSGRFMSSDPYQGSGDITVPSSLNRYTYAESDPVNQLDPSGLATCSPSGFTFGYDAGYGETQSFADVYCTSTFGTIGRSAVIFVPRGDPHDPLYYASVVGLAVSGLGASIDAEELGAGIPNSVLPVGGAEARANLEKGNCFRLLGFQSAIVARNFFDRIVFHYQSYGRLQVQGGVPAPTSPPPANTVGAGQININTDYNWGNFSRVTTSTGTLYNYLSYMNGALGTNMTSTQLATMIIIHELRHNRSQDEESARALLEIYNACIK